MKKSVIDKAIDELESQRTAARVKFQAEDAAMAAAIAAIRGQQRTPRKPRAVKPVAEKAG